MPVLEPNESGGMDQLSFVSAERAGGPNVAGRSYSDFAINGRPLHAIIGRDLVSVFGCLGRELEREYARRLWPKEHTTSRAVLYVCGQCGDLGCGDLWFDRTEYRTALGYYL